MAEYIPADLNIAEPGDRLVMKSSVWGTDSMRVVTVTRVTKAQVLTEMSKGGNETRWSKKTGTIVGLTERWSRPYLYQLTDEVREQLRRRQMLDDITSMATREKLHDASDDKLATIRKALDLPDTWSQADP